MPSDTCEVSRCRKPSILIYMRWSICASHWEGHCSEKHHILVKLGKVPQDFEQRVENIQNLLDRGNPNLVAKWGPVFSGKLPLDVFRPYLKDNKRKGAKYSAPLRLPMEWKDLITPVIKRRSDAS